MLLDIHPENPQPRLIRQVADCLLGGGIVIYPTDTIYGLGCDIYHPDAIERLCRIKGINPSKAQFSFICRDLKHLSDYAKSIDNSTFRLLRRNLPGPFTFILPSSKMVPKPGEQVEEYTDPEIIHEKFGHLVDIVISGGIGGSVPSTIVDCTGHEPHILRQGLRTLE